MNQKIANVIIIAYAVLFGLLALGAVVLFAIMAREILAGNTFSAPTYVQIGLIIPTVILFVYLFIGLFKRDVQALSLLVAILYSLIVMTLVILVLLLLQFTSAASSRFVLFVLLLAFLLASVYLFDISKDIKALFKAPTPNTLG